MLIDLSVPLNNDTPAYPGDPSFTIKQDTTIEKDGYLGHSLTMGMHTGTHIDAPVHMLQGAATLGQLPIQTFTGQGRLVRGMNIEALDAADIQQGTIVLFDSGTAARYYDSSYFTDYPILPGPVIARLIALKIRMIGLDTCSADNTPGFPVHKQLLGAGIPIIENLTNLGALDGSVFTVFAFPLKIDADGAPARVVAELPDA